MFKKIFYYLSVSALTLSAAQFEIPLKTLPRETHCAFFLDFKEIKPDSATMKLTASDGTEIPFSFDFSYGAPRLKKGESPRKIDGFYSKETAPLSAGKYIYPGWISFIRKKGIENYTLSFDETKGKVLARPLPSVRIWWMELMNDPLLKRAVKAPFYEFGGAAGFKVTSLEKGGIKLSQPRGAVRLYTNFYPAADKRLCGRNLVVYTVLSSEKGAYGQFSLPFASAIRKGGAVIHVYFKLAPGEKFAQYAEGIVETDPAHFWNCRHARKNLSFLNKGDLAIHELRMHAPPAPAGVQLYLKSSTLVNNGEKLQLAASNLNREILQKMTFTAKNGRKIHGGRAVNWAGNWKAQIKIKNAAGKILQSSNSLEFTLAQLSAGNYTMESAILAKDTNEVIASRKDNLVVGVEPQW